VAGAFGTAMALVFALSVYATYRTAMRQYSDRARVISEMVEGSITRTLESAETSLVAVAASTRRAAMRGPIQPTGSIADMAQKTLLFAPYLRHLVVTDGEGRVLVDSAVAPKGRQLDLQRLGLSRTGEGGWEHTDGTQLHRGLTLGTPIPGRYLPMVDAPPDLSSRSLVPMMVVADSDHLVVGALNPSSLRRILDHGRLGPAGAVWLTSLDGTPLVTAETPDRSVLTGRTLWLTPAVREGTETALFPLNTPQGNSVEGYAAFRLSARYPVAVVVAVTLNDGLRAWLEEDGSILFWSVVSLLGLLICGAFLTRETVRRISLENRLRLVNLTEAVFAHSAEAMLITDNDGHILAANPSFLTITGYDAGAVAGRSASDFLSQTEPDGPAEDDDVAPSPDASSRTDVWHLWCQTGEPRSVDYREAPLFQDAIIVTLNDVTDRIAAEKALTEAARQAELANRAKSEFLASMSHELRTPLNAILGFSEILRDQVFGPVGSPQYQEYASDIHDSATHLRDTINDLLDLAKIEAGTFDLDPAPLDVNQEIVACCRLVNARAHDHGLTLSCGPPVPNPILLVDGRAFRQMLLNLLSNAVKFTPAGGRITVSVRHDSQGRLNLAVQDTGIGIPDSEQDRVFHAYEPALTGAARQIQGSGLGLALVKSMMDLHGGEVTLVSTPDRGSTFTLVFPAERCLPRMPTG